MNVGGLVASTTSVFFVLALAISPASAMSSMRTKRGLSSSPRVRATRVFIRRHDEIPRELLLQQGRLVLALILAHVAFSGRMDSLAQVEDVARTRFDHLRSYGSHVSHSGLRNRRAPTLARRYQRGRPWTVCLA